MAKFIVYSVIVLGALYFLMAFAEFSILVNSDIVRRGENYEISGHGNIGSPDRDIIVCKYFNGRAIVPLWEVYSHDPEVGKSSCETIFSGFIKSRI
jgi:hypothetical protein